MTSEDVRAFVRRHLDLFLTRDPATLAANHAEDGVVESPSAGRQNGRTEIASAYERWFAAFPDLQVSMENLVADSNRAAVFVRVNGTHRGDFMGLPPTGKRIEFQAVLLQEIDGDLIAHERRMYDFSALLIQLGLLKVRPS